nr:uncharacterized protein LOC129270374 [Lytechinus pictus]
MQVDYKVHHILFYFSTRSSSLNCEKIIELLTSHLASSHNLHLLCLFGIEGILKEDVISSDVALSLLSPHLTSLQDSQDKAVRAKSLKILRQLERLEADTSLDQPLMPEGQLKPQSVFEAAGQDIPGPLVNTTPMKAAVSRETPSAIIVGNSKTSGGSLFSGMTVAARPQVSPEDQVSTGMSSSASCRTKDSEGYPVSDLLIDNQFMSESGSSEANLLLSDAKKNLVSNHETHGNSSLMSSPVTHGVIPVNPVGVSEHQDVVDREATQHRSVDPIMSREAGFADLWKTVSPKKASSHPKASSDQVLSKLSTVNPQVDMPSQRHPSGAFQQPVMTAQHISQMYPQLSSVMLSGTTSVPINLAKKPTTGFGFVVDTDDEQQKAATSRDAFSFIQDAMKNSKS